MATKKKNTDDELKYLQLPLPEGNKRSTLTKVSFHGLNMAQKIDTGVLCNESNISTTYAPYLTPSSKRVRINSYDKIAEYKDRILSIHAFEDVLIVIYEQDISVNRWVTKIDYYKRKLNGFFIRTGILQDSDKDFDMYMKFESKPRSIVRFNVYDSDDPINGSYIKKLLIFPDKKSMDYIQLENESEINLDEMSINIKTYYNSKSPYKPPANADKSYYQKNEDDGDGYGRIFVWGTDDNGRENWIRCENYENGGYPQCPDIDYATVHLSRLFGVGNGRVFASGFNDYSNWNLDTADEYNANNAWVSSTQSNTEADSDFVGIKTFQSHVVAFKKNYTHEVYNSKNPFRIYDIFNEGCINGKTIQEVDGKLFFLGSDNVKIYTGSNPKNIGYALGIEKFESNLYDSACAGTDGRKYYLYCETTYPATKGNYIYVYDTYCEQWAIEKLNSSVIGFANNNLGVYMACNDGTIYRLDDRLYDGQEWSFETDFYTGKTINIKHLTKIQVLCDMRCNSELKIYMILDDDKYNNKKIPLYATVETRGDGEDIKRSIRFVPRQTANYGFKLHFEGKGYIKIYSLEMQMSSGGEKYIE